MVLVVGVGGWLSKPSTLPLISPGTCCVPKDAECEPCGDLGGGGFGMLMMGIGGGLALSAVPPSAARIDLVLRRSTEDSVSRFLAWIARSKTSRWDDDSVAVVSVAVVVLVVVVVEAVDSVPSSLSSSSDELLVVVASSFVAVAVVVAVGGRRC